MELGDTLNFLDLILIKRYDRLIFNWYQKPTFSGRFLIFLSQHPFLYKKDTIISYRVDSYRVDRVDRVFLSHPKFHKDNLILLPIFF